MAGAAGPSSECRIPIASNCVLGPAEWRPVARAYRLSVEGKNKCRIEVDTQAATLPQERFLLEVHPKKPETSVQLDLSGCSSLVQLPANLFDISAEGAVLEEVDLSGCSSLTSLPLQLVDAHHLKKLVLKGCTALKRLPPTLGDLPVLEEVDLSDCTSLTKLPKSLGHVQSLRSLNCSGCSSLGSVPLSLGNLPKLHTLDLTGCGKLDNLDEVRKLPLRSMGTRLRVLTGGTRLVDTPVSVPEPAGVHAPGKGRRSCCWFLGLTHQQTQALERLTVLSMLVFVAVLFVSAYTPFQSACPAVAQAAGRHLLQAEPSAPSPQAAPPPQESFIPSWSDILVAAGLLGMLVGLGVAALPTNIRDGLCGSVSCEVWSVDSLLRIFHFCMNGGGFACGILGMSLKLSTAPKSARAALAVLLAVLGYLLLLSMLIGCPALCTLVHQLRRNRREVMRIPSSGGSRER